MQIKYLMQLIRPEQWVKCGFIFLPIFFDGQILVVEKLWMSFVAFVAFSLAASAIYCFNDVLDVASDRLHPKKCKRPVAAGKITIKTVYVIIFACITLSMLTLYFLGSEAKYSLMALIAFYFVMNIAYCMYIKHFAIIDVTVISVGFVMRVIAGGLATNIWISEWIMIMTFLLSLFLAFAKRRDDVILFQSTGVQSRRNTTRYNLDFMNQVMTVISTIVIIAYIMYTLQPDVTERFNNRPVYLTAIFVLVGIIRYMQITFVDLKSGDPTKILLKDRFIQCCIGGWVITFLIIIYL